MNRSLNHWNTASTRRSLRLSSAAAWLLTATHSAQAVPVPSEWNAGSGNWNIVTNWFPNDVPDDGGGFTYDVQIGNRPVAVNAQVSFIPEDGTSDTITSLIMSGGADLFTNGSQLNVLTQATVTGANASIRVEPNTTPSVPSFQTINLDLDGGGSLLMLGGIATVNGMLEINAGSQLQGRGRVDAGDFDAVVEQCFENSNLLQVLGALGSTGEFTLHANGVDLIDLDGDSETGIVDVSNAVADVRSDTLELTVEGPLGDAFGGTLQIGQRDTVIFTNNFTMDGATVQMAGGTVPATLEGAGDITAITNTSITVVGDAVISNDMTFSGAANTLNLAAGASLTLNGTVNIPDTAALVPAAGSEWIIGGNTTLTEAAADFDWDGPGDIITTINANGFLSLAVNHVDAGVDVFNGVLNLNDGGDLTVNVTAGTSWTMDGVLTKNNAGVSTILGDAVNLAGTVAVDGGTLDMPATTLSPGANIKIDGLMTLGAGSVFAGPAAINGNGTLRVESISSVSASTTVATSTFDWDGNGAGSQHSIHDAAVFTITSTVFDNDGDMDDPVTLGGNGAQLAVSGPAQWTMLRELTTNSLAFGTATIGGTSRMILSGSLAEFHANGPTTVSAPITFGPQSVTTIPVTGNLTVSGDAVYDGATIEGAGNFNASAALNTVNGNTTISTTSFNFDQANWVINPGALLTVNVTDYDSDVPVNAFNGTILTLNSGDISVTTGDAAFVMDGILNFNSANGEITSWSGEPLEIGNDAGVLAADLNITGPGLSRIGAPVTFKSDADVNIAAGGRLDLFATATFDTVNAANNAEFTGAGQLTFTGTVNVNEAVTLNMTGGSVDLDGLDVTGDLINIDAPMVINAATLDSFGKVNGAGTNTLDIDSLNAGHAGTLTVNLDAADGTWTLNPQGVLNLVNDNTLATMLNGSDAILNGTVNVAGNVRSNARVEIGATLNILTNGQPFTLGGGSAFTLPNMIRGGTITGPGTLASFPSKSLFGFGTINAPVNFAAGSNLSADDGTLTVNGLIAAAGTIGAEPDGIMNIVNVWNSAPVSFIALRGGELRGGTLTINNAAGVEGRGRLTSRVINNTRITASTGFMVVETAGNDNDWDGAGNNALLAATTNGSLLELRDTATFGFTGTVSATGGSSVFTKNFALDFNPGSTLSLTGSAYQSTNSTDLGGTVTVGAGSESLIDIEMNRFLDFEPVSLTTLNGNLRILSNNCIIRTAATFAGPGALIFDASSYGLAEAGAVINVLFEMRGGFRPAGFDTVGRVDMKDFQMAATSQLYPEFTGTGLNQFDRIVVAGAAQVAGSLDLDIDGGYVPAAGHTFDIITAIGGVTGTFSNVVQPFDMPAGLTFLVSYLPNAVRLTVANVTPYEIWINSFGAIANPADKLKTANPDGDENNNLTEFAFHGDPASGRSTGFIGGLTWNIGGVPVFTLTFPVRTGTVPDPADPAGGVMVLHQTTDGLKYTVSASTDMTGITPDVAEVTGNDAFFIQAQFPLLGPGWQYRTFRGPAGSPRQFLRASVSE